MLYYLYKNNYINESLVQHRVFEKEAIPNSHNFFDYKTDHITFLTIKQIMKCWIK